MKTYWDSSALVEALHNLKNSATESVPTPAVTRRYIRWRKFFDPDQRRKFPLRRRRRSKNAGRFFWKTDLDFVELTAEDAIKTINEASDNGVRGARIQYDLMHAAAAVKSGAKILLTLDTAGFSDLRGTP